MIFIAMFISCVAYGQEQQKECTTMWPYMFYDFEDAKIIYIDGKTSKNKVNVHYRASQLHYLDGDNIREANGGMIYSVTIGEHSFIYFEGGLIKVEAACEDGFVGTVTLADFNRLNEAPGAYGTTSNISATRKLTSMEEIGAVGGFTNVNHMDLRENRKGGVTLYLEENRFVVLPDDKLVATKSGISRELTKEGKKAFKEFEKRENIDWNDPQSILKTVAFLTNTNYRK